MTCDPALGCGIDELRFLELLHERDEIVVERRRGRSALAGQVGVDLGQRPPALELAPDLDAGAVEAEVFSLLQVEQDGAVSIDDRSNVIAYSN